MCKVKCSRFTCFAAEGWPSAGYARRAGLLPSGSVCSKLLCLQIIPEYDTTAAGSQVTELKVQYFDTIPVATAMCILKTGFLFAASESGDHGYYDFLSLGDDDTELQASSKTLEQQESDEGYTPIQFDPRRVQNLAIQDNVMSLAPMTDMKVANLLGEVCTLSPASSGQRQSVSGCTPVPTLITSAAVWRCLNQVRDAASCACWFPLFPEVFYSRCLSLNDARDVCLGGTCTGKLFGSGSVGGSACAHPTRRAMLSPYHHARLWQEVNGAPLRHAGGASDLRRLWPRPALHAAHAAPGPLGF